MSGRRRRALVALLLALLVGLAGCGQKGDLYLPDDPEEEER